MWVVSENLGMMKKTLVALLLAPACMTPAYDEHQDAGQGPGQGPGSGFDTGARIKSHYVTTPDGTKTFTGLYDTKRKEDCSFGIAADNVLRCLPTAPSTWAFMDASCSLPAYIGTCGNQPKYMAYSPSVSACGTPGATTIYLVGGPISGYYVKTLTGCSGPNPSPYVFAVLSEVAASEFQIGVATTE